MKAILFLTAAIGLAGCAPSQRAPIERRPLPITRAPEVAHVIPAAGPVRIGLVVDAASITASGDVGIRAVDVAGSQIGAVMTGEQVFSARGGRVVAGQRTFPQVVRLAPAGAGLHVRAGRFLVRGVVEIRATAENRITVVNQLGVDDYLKGVLPREVIVSWPEEALKAQAVASRTYLFSNLGKHRRDGFDLCAAVHCQVYGGVDREDARTNAAVDTTRGQVLLWHEKPATTFFHACCGGRTERAAAVWAVSDQDYLPQKSCPYCSAFPHFDWTATLTDGEIIQRLTRATNVRGARLLGLTSEKSGSGRAEKVAVRTDEGRFVLSGNAFRLALGPERIRSLFWTRMSRVGGGVDFRGRGWGHGVGMCQWGAKGQAEAGRSYREILGFYYPGTVFAQWAP